jgi:hypothetical protein
LPVDPLTIPRVRGALDEALRERLGLEPDACEVLTDRRWRHPRLALFSVTPRGNTDRSYRGAVVVADCSVHFPGEPDELGLLVRKGFPTIAAGDAVQLARLASIFSEADHPGASLWLSPLEGIFGGRSVPRPDPAPVLEDQGHQRVVRFYCADVARGRLFDCAMTISDGGATVRSTPIP